MPVIKLLSLEDPRLEPYRNLKDTNATRWQGQFIAEGDKLLVRLLESDFAVVSVLLAESFVNDWAPAIPADVTALVLPDVLVRELVGFNFHRGILACGRRKAARPLAEVLSATKPTLLVVVCPAVHDPENLGAIIRNSAAFGADLLLLGTDCCDPFSRRVLRVSMGTGLRIPILQAKDLRPMLSELREQWGVETIATVLDASAEPLEQVQPKPRTSLVLGSEGNGLTAEWIAACDRRVTIRMPAGVDSLNVATAAGIFLYHFTHLLRR